MLAKVFAAAAMMVSALIPVAPPPGVTAEVWAAYRAIPTSNTDRTHFDAIIVLGTPTNPDGSLSAEQASRMAEGVREWKRGVAKYIIPTGGAAHNSFVEAHAMKTFAVLLGVPAEDVIEEPQARDTIENIWYSWAIMQQHGWTSAEVVSSPSHLPRTALILAHYPQMQWRTQAAPWPPAYDQVTIDRKFAGEANGCWTLEHDGFKPNEHLPTMR